MMKKLYGIMAALLFCATLYGQNKVDSVELRAKPILSDQPILFDPSGISNELNAIKKPILKPEAVTVEGDNIRTRFDSQEALKLTVPEVEVDDVKKSWSKILKRSSAGKLKSNGNQITCTDVTFDEVTDDTYDVVMQFDTYEKGSWVWMTLEADSMALSSEGSPSAFKTMQEYLIYQGKIDYRDKVNDDIKDQQKVVDDLHHDLDKTIDKCEKMHKDITDNNIKIDERNQEIDDNQIERKMVGRQVVEARQEMKNSRNSDNEKENKKAYNRVNKDKSRLEKDRKKYFNQIVDYKKEIAENEQGITANLQEQKELLLKIKTEELMLEALQDKLAAI